jgi:tetratricopeptide (TPR) repeat protein
MASDPADEAKAAGNAHLSVGEFTLAIKAYTEAIHLSKGRDHTLFSNRAFAFTKLGNFERAIADANESINLSPRWPKGFFRRAEGFRLCGLPVEALQAYRVASSLDPSDEHLRACVASASAEVRRAERRDLLMVGSGLAIGLVLAVALVVSEALAKGKVSSVGSLITVALSLCTLGGLGGVTAREIYRHALNAKAATPSLSNTEFVRRQFTYLRVPKAKGAAPSVAEGAGAPGGHADEGEAEPAKRRAVRSTNKSFRNRGA